MAHASYSDLLEYPIIKRSDVAGAGIIIVLSQVCWPFIVFSLAASLHGSESRLSFENRSNLLTYHYHEMGASSLLWKVEIWPSYIRSGINESSCFSSILVSINLILLCPLGTHHS